MLTRKSTDSRDMQECLPYIILVIRAPRKCSGDYVFSNNKRATKQFKYILIILQSNLTFKGIYLMLLLKSVHIYIYLRKYG